MTVAGATTYLFFNYTSATAVEEFYVAPTGGILGDPDTAVTVGVSTVSGAIMYGLVLYDLVPA